MKSFVLLICIAISNCEPKNKLAPAVLANCPLVPIENYSQTILIDMNIPTNVDLKSCLLKTSLFGHSVVIINRVVFDKEISIQPNLERKFIRTNEYPNVVIITKYFTLETADSIMLKLILKSFNWSLVYFIVTGDNKYRCRNGTMNTSDWLLLDNAMNKIWHKFKIMRVGVAFPYACEHKMLVYNSKRPPAYGLILYDRSIKLINATNYEDLFAAIRKSGEKLSENYPIKASIFERYPTSIKDCSNLHYYAHFNLNLSLGYCGLDGMVMHDLIKHFKFNLSFPENEICNAYGFAIPGNISGSLGCIVRNELDISFNSRFMTLYSDEHIYYLHYVITDQLCAFVRRTGLIPVWHGAFNVYTPPVWLLITGVLVIISGIIWGTAIVNKRLTGQKIRPYWYYLHHTVVMTMTGTSTMKKRTLYMMRSTCLAGSVLFLAVYQGHTNRVYTTLRRIKQIGTLEELYKSGMTLYTSASLREISKQLLNPENKLQVAFFNRSQLTPDGNLGIVMQKPFSTTLERKSDAEMEILKKYSDKHGTPLIDTVAECLHTYYLSYIARSGFPFFEDLQVFTERLKEAGLPEMYYRWTQQMLNIPTSMPENHSEPRPFSKIRLSDQRVAFIMLFVGTVLSFIVFVIEVWKGSRHKKLERNIMRFGFSVKKSTMFLIICVAEMLLTSVMITMMTMMVNTKHVIPPLNYFNL